jgi:hypothetical protein
MFINAMFASVYVIVYGYLWNEISTFQAAMMTLLRTNVGSVSNKVRFMDIIYEVYYSHGNFVELALAWLMATVVNKLILGTIYVSYFFSVVLYPYARYKAQAMKTTTVTEDAANRVRWILQVGACAGRSRQL